MKWGSEGSLFHYHREMRFCGQMRQCYYALEARLSDILSDANSQRVDVSHSNSGEARDAG